MNDELKTILLISLILIPVVLIIVLLVVAATTAYEKRELHAWKESHTIIKIDGEKINIDDIVEHTFGRTYLEIKLKDGTTITSNNYVIITKEKK